MNIPIEDYNNIKGLAKKYHNKSFAYIDVNDLVQEGCLAYLKGLEKYDKEKNPYYMGFIYKRVVGAMLDFIASQSLQGAATVRSFEASKSFKVVPLPLNYEAIGESNEDELIEQVCKEQLFERFKVYLKLLTSLEVEILLSYFVDKRSMVYIGTKLHISRLKIKRIIVACITYLRNRFSLEYIDIDFKSLSKA